MARRSGRSVATAKTRSGSQREGTPFAVLGCAVLAAFATAFVAASGGRLVGSAFVASTPRTRAWTNGATALQATIASEEMVKTKDSRMNPGEVNEETFKHARVRNVTITNKADLAELLKVKNPMMPTPDIALKHIYVNDKVITWPTLGDLKRLRVSKQNEIVFTWVDKSKTYAAAPREFDGMIQRMLNAGPSEMEDLVRANWKAFNKGFFFRIAELKEDTDDMGLKGKLSNLHKAAMGVIEAGQRETRKNMPESRKDVQDLLEAMLEQDADTLLVTKEGDKSQLPFAASAYARLAAKIDQLALRNDHSDHWFETMIELVERYGGMMQKKGHAHHVEMAKAINQRLVTVFLAQDALWEETDEGKFIAACLNITHWQWADQLRSWITPLEVSKLRDELKIISETKIMNLPLSSKLQSQAASYVEALNGFFLHKDQVLGVSGPDSDEEFVDADLVV